MGFFPRKRASSLFRNLFRSLRIEHLEDRTLPSANPLFAQFQSVGGLLTIHDNTPVSVSLSAGFVEVNAGGQVLSSNPAASNYNPALAGATGQSLTTIQLTGNAASDQLILGNVTAAGGLSVQTDGVLQVQGQVSAAGPIELDAHAVLLVGQVRADGAAGGSITVNAASVLQSGLLEANGSQGNGGAIHVNFSNQYEATVSALTSANSAGAGNGGLVDIDGAATGNLFTSGQYQANAHGGQGGHIELFGQQVHLVGANVSASGWSGGGWIRVGGDSPSDIAAHGGATAGVTNAVTTTVDATTTLSANALGNGNGGRIVIWSQNTTTFAGSIQAQGAGAGQGGLLEVSSAGQLNYGGQATATAASGKQGQLLLDPKNITISDGLGLPQFDLINPNPDNHDTFGSSIVVLSNGNVVVADPNDGSVASNAGAVFLYNGQTGALLGELTGSTSSDFVGFGPSGTNGITVLSNGNFVVSSPNWQDAGNAVGAATWVSGNLDSIEAVSEANSLVGSTSGDQLGSGGITALANGNYVVDSPFWQDSNANQVGAVTWGNGLAGTVGFVSASNSLVGSNSGDDVGVDGVTALTNGNYVVSSSSWQNPNGTSGGAVTWGNGVGGTVGPVSASNSLVAPPNGGDVGGHVTALSDGNYVVCSPGWGTAALSDLGAATWGNGSSGTVGEVNATNSLTGSSGFDQVGSGGAVALANGNYVVSSPQWGGNLGAATFGLAGSTAGTVNSGNSLVGSTSGDEVGIGGVVALTNGNYVVSSFFWQGNLGAVTLCQANGSTVGTLSAGNSLVGSTAGDMVGFGTGNPGSGIVALQNGNYVVDSPNWQSGGGAVGAVTFGFANGSTVGTISISNSLLGSTAGDTTGSGGVTVLTNGNYVVSSPNWQNTVGAVTLGMGDGSTVGAVTAGNSLIGSTNGDQVGFGSVTALSNGNYVVNSPKWQSSLGAATWVNGATGQTVDSTNSPDAVNSVVGIGSGNLLTTVLGLPGGNAFLADFTGNGTSGNGGTVVEALLTASSETYATAPTQDVTMSPSLLEATLNTGTAVVLQANNDITITSPITVNNPNPHGKGGDLTLQAGRNIIIEASITTDNGNLTLIGNDTAADGVVDSQRLAGVGAITMTGGTSLNAGTGNVTVTLNDGAGNSHFATDDITMGDITAANVTLTNNGPGDASIGGTGIGSGVDMASVTVTGNLTVVSTGDITQAGALGLNDPGIINVGGATRLTAAGPMILLTNNQNVFAQVVTYSDPGGSVTIEASGDLVLASATAPAQLTVVAGGALGESNPLTVSGAASFQANSIALNNVLNAFQGVVSLTSTGSVDVVNSTPLTVNNLTVAAASSLSATSITLTGALNVGSQTLTLTSTSPASLGGTTTIANGTITDTSGLVVASGASLSGSGTLQPGAASVLVQAGATLAPGTTPLIVSGNLTLSAASILSEQIAGAQNFSQLTVNGAINLGGATLQVSLQNQFTPAYPNSFQIITNVPDNAVTGNFAQGSSLTVGGATLLINYASGNNNVVLNAAPKPPVAGTVVVTMPENSPATTIDVLSHDSGTSLTVTQVGSAADGTSGLSGGVVSYQPTASFSGVDQFNYTITDAVGQTATGTVVGIVTGPPVANPDVATILENSGPTAISVLANDTGSQIQISSVTQGASGTVAITNNGSQLTYKPDSNTYGMDQFTYTIKDSANNTATATVIVIVSPVTAAPVVNVPGMQTLVANQALVITGISTSDASFDENNGPTTATLSVQNGTITLANTFGLTSVLGNGSGSVSVSGPMAYVNLALSSLTYQPNRDTLQADTLTINVTVNSVSTPNTVTINPAVGVFKVADPGLAGKTDLVIQGAGNDTITVAPGKAANSYTVTVNHIAQTVTGINGRILAFDQSNTNNSISLSSTVKLPALLVAGDGTNTLVGGAGNDTLMAGNGNNTLTGGGGNDTIQTGTGSNKIDGGSGTNTLIETGDVDFTLVAGTGTKNGSLSKGPGITDTLVLNHIQTVRLSLTGLDPHTIDGTKFSGTEIFTAGGTGNDTLLAGSGNDILIGGGGTDSLKAGNGKDILIAGSGAATLDASNTTGQDILIAGTTSYDANIAALNSVMAEWASADSYSVKIARLMGTKPGGKNGQTFLTATGADPTVQKNGKVNTLNGGKGLDWFWASAADTVNNFNSRTETKTVLT